MRADRVQGDVRDGRSIRARGQSRREAEDDRDSAEPHRRHTFPFAEVVEKTGREASSARCDRRRMSD
jgi:hypothetical protein